MIAPQNRVDDVVLKIEPLALLQVLGQGIGYIFAEPPCVLHSSERISQESGETRIAPDLAIGAIRVYNDLRCNNGETANCGSSGYAILCHHTACVAFEDYNGCCRAVGQVEEAVCQDKWGGDSASRKRPVIDKGYRRAIDLANAAAQTPEEGVGRYAVRAQEEGRATAAVVAGQAIGSKGLNIERSRAGLHLANGRANIGTPEYRSVQCVESLKVTTGIPGVHDSLLKRWSGRNRTWSCLLPEYRAGTGIDSKEITTSIASRLLAGVAGRESEYPLVDRGRRVGFLVVRKRLLPDGNSSYGVQREVTAIGDAIEDAVLQCDPGVPIGKIVGPEQRAGMGVYPIKVAGIADDVHIAVTIVEFALGSQKKASRILRVTPEYCSCSHIDGFQKGIGRVQVLEKEGLVDHDGSRRRTGRDAPGDLAAVEMKASHTP